MITVIIIIIALITLCLLFLWPFYRISHFWALPSKQCYWAVFRHCSHDCVELRSVINIIITVEMKLIVLLVILRSMIWSALVVSLVSMGRHTRTWVREKREKEREIRQKIMWLLFLLITIPRAIRFEPSQMVCENDGLLLYCYDHHYIMYMYILLSNIQVGRIRSVFCVGSVCQHLKHFFFFRQIQYTPS